MAKKEPVYKVLNNDNESCHGGFCVDWKLPTKISKGIWKPGEWMECFSEVVTCRFGWHVATAGNLQEWYTEFDKQKVYLAEVKGEQDRSHSGKIAAQFIRLIRPLDKEDLVREGILKDCTLYTYPAFHRKVTSILILGNSDIELDLLEGHNIKEIVVHDSSKVLITGYVADIIVSAFDNSLIHVSGGVCEASDEAKVRAENDTLVNVCGPKVQVFADDIVNVKYHTDSNPKFILLGGNATLTYTKRNKTILRTAPGTRLEVEEQVEKFDMSDVWDEIKEQHENSIQKQTKK